MILLVLSLAPAPLAKGEMAPVILSFIGDKDGVALEGVDAKFLTKSESRGKTNLAFTRSDVLLLYQGIN